MTRLSQLPRHIYLDLIEEARWQNGSEFVYYCIEIDAPVSELCQWGKTRQGYDYWSWIDKGLFYQMN